MPKFTRWDDDTTACARARAMYIYPCYAGIPKLTLHNLFAHITYDTRIYVCVCVCVYIYIYIYIYIERERVVCV
jgi:hypothetical protein